MGLGYNTRAKKLISSWFLSLFPRYCVMSAHETIDKHTIFVFVDTEPTEDIETMKKILALDEVIDVHIVSGQYDLLVVLELSLHGTAIFTSVQEVAQKAIQKIRKISGVRDTSTLVPFVSLTKRVG